MAEMIDRWSGELEARTLAKTCYLTIDSAFPQFPGAEMWNPPGVRLQTNEILKYFLFVGNIRRLSEHEYLGARRS